MHGEPFDPRDPAPGIDEVEAHGAHPLAVHLDHEPAERVRLALGALDLGKDQLAVGRRVSAQERAHVVVSGQLEQEGGVVRGRTSQRDRHDSEASRRRMRSGSRAPVASATPPRINASAANAAAPKVSPRKTAPYASAIGGIR